MQIRIDLTTPRTLRGNPHYDAAIQQLGRWSKQTDSDLIPGARMPREIAVIAEYVDDCDEQASRNEHVYRADIEIVRSPDEGNLYWGRGYGQEYRDQAALNEARAILGDCYSVQWTGNSNTDADGESTDDIAIELRAPTANQLLREHGARKRIRA